MNDPETQRLLDKFSAAWERYTHATDSDARYEAKGDYQQYAVELALWMMNCPTTETPTELEPDSMWGNSPDESEVPNNSARKLTVRDILDQMHTAARDHRKDVPGARDAHYILRYIERKEAEAHQLKMHGKAGFARTLQHIRAIRISTSDPSERLHGIERVIAVALALPSQVVQS